MRGLRQAFVAGTTDAERAVLEHALAGRVSPLLPPGSVVGSYAAFGTEIDPALAAPHAALPWFADRNTPMQFRLGPPVAVGAWAVRQPAGDAPVAEPDVILVPLLAAAADGVRLGMGAGHYDRWLAAARARRPVTVIGVGWDFQLLDAVPADAHDQPIDWFVSPARTVRCR